jgi:hypothetical protein
MLCSAPLRGSFYFNLGLPAGRRAVYNRAWETSPSLTPGTEQTVRAHGPSSTPEGKRESEHLLLCRLASCGSHAAWSWARPQGGGAVRASCSCDCEGTQTGRSWNNETRRARGICWLDDMWGPDPLSRQLVSCCTAAAIV